MSLNSLKLIARAPLAIIALAGIALCLPMVLYGFPAYSHDGWIHALWSANFSSQLWAGELYPRWLAGSNRGLGSPALFFYPPLPYYLTSLFKPFFSPIAQGWQPLGFSALAAVIGSGWCVYLWLRRMVGNAAASAAAVFYMALPYHLIIDLYVRGAFAEVFAFVWMPLALYFTLRFEDHQKLALIGLATSYALLIASHLPTALIFTPLPLGYACFVAEPSERSRRGVLTVCALGLGAGLSAIYLLPAVALRQFVSMQLMQESILYFENWFILRSFSWRAMSTPLTLSTILVLALAVGLFAVVARTQDKSRQREGTFWLCTSVFAFLMMTPASLPVWLLLPLLQNIQFPYRYNTILAVSATALFALAVHSAITAKGTRLALVGRVVATSALLVVFIPTAAYGWRQYKIHNQQTAARSGLVENNLDAPEYRPRWADRNSLPSNRVNILEGDAEVSIESQQPRRISLNINAISQTMIDIPQLYFPGWQWRLIGASEFQDAQPAPQSGLVRIAVPGGKHRVELQLNATWPERSGQVVSAVCCVALILIGARRRRH